MKTISLQFTDHFNRKSGESVMDISFGKHQNSCSFESSKSIANACPLASMTASHHLGREEMPHD